MQDSFTHFSRKQELFDKHSAYCSNNETVAVKMPARNTILRFENYHKQLPIPFVVYADFECFTKPMDTFSPNPNNSYTYSYQKHAKFSLLGVNVWYKKILSLNLQQTHKK